MEKGKSETSEKVGDMSLSIYVASGLENIDAARALIAELVHSGHRITYDWTKHGSLQGSPERWREVAAAELNGVVTADVVVILMPGGRGTHTELGAALAAKKPVLFVGPRETNGRTCIFYHHPCVLDVVSSGTDVVPTLRAWAEGKAADTSSDDERRFKSAGSY